MARARISSCGRKSACGHRNPCALGSESGIYKTRNRERLFRLLAGRPNLYSVAGHTHTTDHVYFGENDGFRPRYFSSPRLAAVSGSWWSGPFDERGVAISDQRDGTPSGYHARSRRTDMAVRYKGQVDRSARPRIMFDILPWLKG